MNIPDLNGKTALVTGASRGIGKAIAVALAKAGAHVLALARTSGALEELDDEIKAAGGNASLIPMDLIEGDNIERLAGALTERFEKLDILVLNAAILGELAPLPDIDPKVWKQTLDLNVTANWRLLRALDPILRKSDSGHVMFLTSAVGGEYARAFWGAYAVSKAALEMLAETYAEETKKSSLHISIVNPGATRTDMRALAMPGEDPMTLPAPEELTPMIYEALADKRTELKRYSFRQWRENGN
ncbi:SDR family NAD(P)-dependent oxidoreductase [Hyphococcus flavus]|uniref:SDR family NAD(P)-dependent oxidoreductase n=1 Tax=Hyphococcus flavus TaxID=1866326 RepID=A0AAF0CFK0_9PROT|nr:SDR family NAD(P)-dependent oxidoreductase [Hyphococcus flavus]WDI31484.1 SDR family NAD(P)-dependent oxidoreductase [Hyphococcus flavus]